MSNVYKRNRTQSPLDVINKSKELLKDTYQIIMNENKVPKKHRYFIGKTLYNSANKYVRYMDDFIIFCKNKSDAQEMLEIVKDEVRKAKLILNENKTYICKITHRFTFLKTDFKITKTGKIIKMLTRQNVTKQRQKLKKLSKMVDDGLLTYKDVQTSYQSWRGYALKKNAYNTIKSMDKLFNELFINQWINLKP